MYKLFLILSLFFVAPFSISAQIGDIVFNENVLHNIYVTTSLDQAVLIDTLKARKYSGDYTNVDVDFDGVVLSNVGIKFKGNYSYTYANTSDKKPIKFDFGEFVSGQKHDGLTKVNLVNSFGDPSFMRDAVSYKLLREMGVPAPRTSFAKVHINGSYFGLYLLVEEQDKKFLEHNSFLDKNGNLYKANFSDLVYDGGIKEDYLDNFEQQLKNQGDTTWSDLIKFHQTINNSDNFSTNIQNIFQLEYFLKSIAVDFVVANWDNFLGHGRNFSLYHSTTNNKFYWLPWDYGFAFGDQLPFDQLLWAGFINNEYNNFWNNCMSVPAIKNQYLQYICQANSIMTYERLDEYINELRTLITQAVITDPNKHYTFFNFNNAIDSQSVTVMEIFSPTLGPEPREYPGLKYKIVKRNEEVANLLKNQDIDCISGTDFLDFGEVKVYPNPASDYIDIQMEFKTQSTINLFSIDGRLIESYVDINQNIVLPISHLTKGVYLIKLINDRQSKTFKFIKDT